MTTRVLVTCPPMVQMIGDLAPRFERLGWDVEAPEVKQTLSEDALSALLPDVDGWIIGDDPATHRVMSAGRRGRLRAMVKWGVGVDNVDFEAARALGLPVTNTPNMFGREVADVALSYVIALARETFVIDRGVRRGEWPKPPGISLHDKTVGVVGLGDIGRNVVRRMRAIGMEVVGYDPGVKASPEDGVRLATWPDGIETCDFLVLACALTPANRHMLNEGTLDLCKPGVRVVNVARGPLIDTEALVSALEDGRVHSAALDVMEDEPLPPGSPLLRFERCIFGSHNGSNTVEAVRATSERAIDLLHGFLDG